MDNNNLIGLEINNDNEESKMAPDIEQSRSDEITEALKRLANISSNYLPDGKRPLQSTVFIRVREGESIRIGRSQDDDELSSPTVSCMSFTDDDFSLASTEEILREARNRPPLEFGLGDDISMSSINSIALKRISDLKNKLEVQENTKLELLNQCMRLETELEKVDSNFARARILKAENAELREQGAKFERDLMNEMNRLIIETRKKENEYEDQLRERDKTIEKLEQDIRLLQLVKNIDPPSVITISKKSS